MKNLEGNVQIEERIIVPFFIVRTRKSEPAFPRAAVVLSFLLTCLLTLFLNVLREVWEGISVDSDHRSH